MFKQNRALNLIERAAHEIVRGRFTGRTPTTAVDILVLSGVPPTAGVNALLSGVAEAANIPLEHTDALADLFRVACDLLPDISVAEWTDSKLGEFANIGVHDLMYVAETNTSRELWTWRWESLCVRPESEEAWIAVMLEMRLDEFLRFFGSRSPSGGQPPVSLSNHALLLTPAGSVGSESGALAGWTGQFASAPESPFI